MHPAARSPQVPDLWRSIRNGVLASTIVLFALTLAMMQVSGEIGTSTGVAAMAAFWGGPGFGVMAGAAVHSIKKDRATKAEAERQAVDAGG